MASEVNHHVGYSRENECWFVRFYPYQTEQQASEAAAAFTRPAPAATDAGLETVEHQYWRDQTQEWLPTGFPDRYRKDGFQVRELVTRSQAEAIIRDLETKILDAAISDRLDDAGAPLSWQERAEKAEAELSAERAEHDNTIATLTSLITDNAALIHDLNRIKDHETELVNDNAAQAARIKELDRCHEGTIDLCNQKTAQIEALEAKLAAAEQFIQFCADGFFVTDDELRGAARAVLGGKP